MKDNPNAIPLIIATLVIAAGAYWYFFTGSEDQQPLTAVSMDNPAQAEFQVPLGEMQSISFDTEIFSDPRFIVLSDLATQITDEPPGRMDPFASIPGVSGK